MTTPDASQLRLQSTCFIIMLFMTSSLCPAGLCSTISRVHRNFATSGSAFDNDDAFGQPMSTFQRVIRVSDSSSSDDDNVDEQMQPKKFHVLPVSKENDIMQGQQLVNTQYSRSPVIEIKLA